MILHEIKGDLHPNERLAKRSAAFKACIELYEKGIIMDNLLPIDTTITVESYHDNYFAHWDKYKDDKKGIAGTKKNLRHHKIMTPEVLVNSAPKVNDVAYMHRITVKPKFDTSQNETLKVFFKLLNNGNTFGIVTSKKIPRLCKILLFQSFGEIECEIEAPTLVELNSDKELEDLRKFHVSIFRDMLNVYEDFFVIDKSSYLLAPIDEYNEINWNLIKQMDNFVSPRLMQPNEINSMNFCKKDYQYNVIFPVYRGTDSKSSSCYIVTNVLEHKTPLSQFCDKKMTYKEYYESKNLKILRNDQFLLEVRGISTNVNLLFPNATNSKKKSKERLELFIPELCHNYKIPGDYWLKATLLPCLCYRLHYLLLADTLHKWLVREKLDENRDALKIDKLDVIHPNYEDREKYLQDIEREDEEDELCGDAEKFKIVCLKNMTNNIVENSAKNNKFSWSQHKLPIEIDKNWPTVSEVDIEYYLFFINQQKKDYRLANQPVASTSSSHNRALAIMNTKTCSRINLLDVNRFLFSVQQKDLIKVLTTSYAADVFDMERFETLGDAFLKFIVSLYLYKKHDKFHEGQLTALKGRIVSNRNLFYVGDMFGFSQMINAHKFCERNQLQGFLPSTTLPDKFMEYFSKNKKNLTSILNLTRADIESDNLPNDMNDENADENNEDDYIDPSLLPYINQQAIGDKMIADCVESFLGCVVASVGIESGLKLCQKLKILPPEENLLGLLTQRIPPRFIQRYDDKTKIPNKQLLEDKLNYIFNDESYLIQALTHASYPIKNYGSYEQLEFLGDAVVDFLVSDEIILCERYGILLKFTDYFIHLPRKSTDGSWKNHRLAICISQ
jgi:dsRNA-specific ribonuclease